MRYIEECQPNGFTTITLTCEPPCQNHLSVSMQRKEDASDFLLNTGWWLGSDRLLCPTCVNRRMSEVLNNAALLH